MNFSTQQNAIFNWFQNGTGNLVVVARAGTGKTTTAIHAIGLAPEARIGLCAFNKRIADELKNKLRNPNAEAATLHSMGFKFVRKNWTSVRVENGRGQELAEQACGSSAPDPMVTLVRKLASKGKNMMATTQAALEDIAFAFDLCADEDFEEQGWTVSRIASCALTAMRLACRKDGTVDFDDMVFLPVVMKWARGTYDLVVVDEAQDMNAAQLALAQMVCRPGGRIAVIGDDRQAIYGFRGADSDSIARLKKELNAAELPLNITYRCPASVVAYAKTLVPDYQAAPECPAGEVKTIKFTKLAEAVQPGDFVLSRKNAPLMATALSFLKLGKAARIEGKDLGKTLVGLVNKLAGRHGDMTDLMRALAEWEQRGVAKAMAGGKTEEAREAKAQEVVDTAETIRALADELTSPAELVARIETLFADDVSGSFIVCSSVHRAKGRETDTVYVLKDTLYPGGRKNLEESNIEYVSVTRAKKTLVWVEGVPG